MKNQIPVIAAFFIALAPVAPTAQIRDARNDDAASASSQRADWADKKTRAGRPDIGVSRTRPAKMWVC